MLCALARNKHGCVFPKAQSSHWLCPSLNEICLIGLRTTRFRCLASVVEERNAQPEANQATQRRNKAFAEYAVSSASATSSAANRVPITPRRLKRLPTEENTISSPNGSLLRGWRAHEVVRPCRIDTVRVTDCARISRVELLSLELVPYSVQTVSSA